MSSYLYRARLRTILEIPGSVDLPEVAKVAAMALRYYEPAKGKISDAGEVVYLTSRNIQDLIASIVELSIENITLIMLYLGYQAVFPEAGSDFTWEMVQLDTPLDLWDDKTEGA